MPKTDFLDKIQDIKSADPPPSAPFGTQFFTPSLISSSLKNARNHCRTKYTRYKHSLMQGPSVGKKHKISTKYLFFEANEQGKIIVTNTVC